MRSPPSLVVAVLALLATSACDRHPGGDGREGPAPSASVITVGVAMGTCPDLEACARECDAGSADRCRRLAATYALGDGTGKDEARATALYEQACAMNDPQGCVFAGQMHEYAHGVPKDDALAAARYGQACDAGWSPGCYNLGILYENGRGVPRDPERAATFYDTACTAGSKVACERARIARRPPFVDKGD